VEHERQRTLALVCKERARPVACGAPGCGALVEPFAHGTPSLPSLFNGQPPLPEIQEKLPAPKPPERLPAPNPARKGDPPQAAAPATGARATAQATTGTATIPEDVVPPMLPPREPMAPMALPTVPVGVPSSPISPMLPPRP